MLRFFLLVFALLPFAALAQSTAEVLAYQSCMQGCDAGLDPCCIESCAWRACIEGNGNVSGAGDRGGIGASLGDSGGQIGAIAVCMPKVAPMQDCRAREAAAMAERNRPKPFIDLACCQYRAEKRGGGTVVTGWFLNASGKRVDYTSEPVDPRSQAGTAYGMFALTTGVGYHVYIVDEGLGPTDTDLLVYVIRFAETVEPLYMLRIGGRFWLDLAPDMSSGKVVYNTPFERDAFLELPLR